MSSAITAIGKGTPQKFARRKRRPKTGQKNEELVDVASVLLAREKRRDTIEHIFTLKRITAAGTRLVVPRHLRVGIDDLSSPRQLLYQLSARGTSSSSASSSLMSPWSMLACGS